MNPELGATGFRRRRLRRGASVGSGVGSASVGSGAGASVGSGEGSVSVPIRLGRPDQISCNPSWCRFHQRRLRRGGPRRPAPAPCWLRRCCRRGRLRRRGRQARRRLVVSRCVETPRHREPAKRRHPERRLEERAAQDGLRGRPNKPPLPAPIPDDRHAVPLHLCAAMGGDVLLDEVKPKPQAPCLHMLPPPLGGRDLGRFQI